MRIFKIIYIIKSEGINGILLRVGHRCRKVKYKILHYFGSNTVKSSYGVLMKKNWLDATFRYCVEGAYGSFFSDHLRQKNTNFSFLDIGANQGLYTLVAAQNPNCINATSFEPVKATFLLLEENIKLNNVSNKCNAIKKGLGKKTENLRIFTRENHSGSARLNFNFNFNENVIEEEIEIVSSEVFNDIEIGNHEHPIICKIDVEGKEIDVLENLTNSMIFSLIEEIFYEVDEMWVNPQDIQDLLKEKGFKVFKKIGNNQNHYDVLATK